MFLEYFIVGCGFTATKDNFLTLVKIFSPQKDDMSEQFRMLHNENFVVYTSHQMLLGY